MWGGPPQKATIALSPLLPLSALLCSRCPLPSVIWKHRTAAMERSDCLIPRWDENRTEFDKFELNFKGWCYLRPDKVYSATTILADYFIDATWTPSVDWEITVQEPTPETPISPLPGREGLAYVALNVSPKPLELCRAKRRPDVLSASLYNHRWRLRKARKREQLPLILQRAIETAFMALS